MSSFVIYRNRVMNPHGRTMMDALIAGMKNGRSIIMPSPIDGDYVQFKNGEFQGLQGPLYTFPTSTQEKEPPF